jgi:hypothetical protein
MCCTAAAAGIRGLKGPGDSVALLPALPVSAGGRAHSKDRRGRERNASHRVSRRKCSRGLVLLAQTEKLLPCPICRAEKWVQFVVAELPEAKPDRISCFSVSTCARRGRSTPLTPTPSLPCAPFFSGHLNCVLDACSPVAIALLGAERSVNKTSSAGNG